MTHRLIRAVVCEIAGLTVPPQTRDTFAAALEGMGHTMASCVDVLWQVAAPDWLSAPAPGVQPQRLRWSLEPALATLLRHLGEFAPDLAIFLDAYELVDDASAALFTALNLRGHGWPLPVISSSRADVRGSLTSEAAIRLGPLPEAAAAELLDCLLRGVELQETLRRDILAHAAGVPVHLEDMVCMLTATGGPPSGDELPAWRHAGGMAAPRFTAALRRAWVHRLEQPTRDLLCQCAIQGVEFDAEVVERGRQLIDWRGPPVRVLLPTLERQNLLQHGSDRPAQWFFARSLWQEVCYEVLSPPERQLLHAKTAEALCDLAAERDAVPPALLAYHYEYAGLAERAAEADLRAGDRAAELCLNQQALAFYYHASQMLDLDKTPSWERSRLAALAHEGAARMHLRLGAYALGAEDIGKMQAVAVEPHVRAEADRLAALVHMQMGRPEEAERLLLNVSSLPSDEVLAPIRAHALCDLARLHWRQGRGAAARERLHECRTILGAAESLPSIRADLLDGEITADEGRLAEAVALYARAYHSAQQSGNLFELARASNGLGIMARHQADYETAQRHFEQALEIWELMGDAEWTAAAYGNLGMLAMSQGDLDAAQAYYERALATSRAIGNVEWSTLANANLAIRALEEEDILGAMTLAEAAVATLSTSGSAMLRGQVLVILGEARLEDGDAVGARQEFDRVIRDYEEARHPLAVAQAWRGLGRVAVLMGKADEALGLFDRALAGFERLQRVQEGARTGLYRAIALRQLGENQRARSELEQTREQFISIRMRARRDAERAERLLRELSAAP
jgi:tetratricopeptide (TPR) repeat protein